MAQRELGCNNVYTSTPRNGFKTYSDRVIPANGGCRWRWLEEGDGVICGDIALIEIPSPYTVERSDCSRNGVLYNNSIPQTSHMYIDTTLVQMMHAWE